MRHYYYLTLFYSVLLVSMPIFAKNRIETLQSFQRKINPEQQKVSDTDIKSYYHTSNHRSADVNDRVIAATDLFLQRPYIFDTLGDGQNGDFDKRPLLTTAGFDCMSLAHVVLAMTVSQDVAEFEKKLVTIRYHQRPISYFNRHHFMSWQWNRHNEKNHFLKDITPTFMDYQQKPVAKTLVTEIDYPQWLQFQKKMLGKKAPLTPQQLQSWQKTYDNAQVQTVELSYIPFETILNPKNTEIILAQIPGGSIIEFVTPNWDLKKVIGTKIDIAHLGFVIVKDNQRIFRHAGFKGVTEMPLIEYIQHAHKNLKKFKGIMVERITLPPKT